MTYEKKLKKLFKGSDLRIEDFLLLDTFQINYLTERLPEKE